MKETEYDGQAQVLFSLRLKQKFMEEKKYQTKNPINDETIMSEKKKNYHYNF